MAYRIEPVGMKMDLVIDGWENGIAPSPYMGIANIRNLNTSYYPGVAYTNYRRQAGSVTATAVFYAGTHSVNVSGNIGWIFAASGGISMRNPVQKATSPAGLHYILDDAGQIWKQTAVNATSFNLLGDGTERTTNGAGGLAYWNNYLVVFGNGVIEFCGDGTGDAGIIATNWNKTDFSSGAGVYFTNFLTDFATFPDRITPTTGLTRLPRFTSNDPVRFTTTGTLPAPLALNTTYYIVTLYSTVGYFTVATTIDGAPITLTTNGLGTHTVTDYDNPLPVGRVTNLNLTFSSPPPIIGSITATLVSYTSPSGETVTKYWKEPTGTYNIVMSDGQKIAASFTNNSSTVTFLSAIQYLYPGTLSVETLDPTVTLYKPYVSKVDGSLLYCNGQFIGRLALSNNTNLKFFPVLTQSFFINTIVTSIPELYTDQVTNMVDLKNNLVVAGKKDIYTWDYVSAATTSPSPVGEDIVDIVNLLNNIFILAGQKGNIYISNGYSAQLFFKMPDYIANGIDTVWSWGGLMVHRSKLFFQALVKTTAGTNILAGIFSLIASPAQNGEQASGLVMEAQNSYGLTPATGALQNGLLIDNSPSALGNDSYYSVWSNGATVGGIDYNDTSLWQNYEPTIETDIIPVGGILNKQTFENVEFKLDRPMVTGDSIQLYFRGSLTDAYTLMGTTTTTQLSEYFPSNLSQLQWVQFKIQMKCAASGSSFIPLREIRFHYKQ